MRILLLGSFDTGALENYYLRELITKTQIVERFDITKLYYSTINRSLFNRAINKVVPSIFFKSINEQLLKFVREKKFDVILVFKGLTLFPDTIEELKRHTILLCCYNPDHPFKFYSEGSGNKNILQSIVLYDIYFSYARRIADELTIRYKVPAYTIPFGYDDSLFPNETPEAIQFVHKWLFIGAYDSERSLLLETLNGNDIEIYGDSKWAERAKNSISKKYKGRALYEMDYKQAIRFSNGVFNFLRKQNIEEQSHNMRTFEVPGCGGVLIANRTEEQMSFFDDDREAIYFDTIVELNDKLDYLRKHPEKIDEIKSAAQHRASRSGYTYRDRTDDLCRILNNHLSVG